MNEMPSPQIVNKVLDSLLIVGNSKLVDEDQPNVAGNVNKLITIFGEKNPELCVETVKNYPKLAELIQSSLLICNNKLFSAKMMNFFLELSVHHPNLSEFILENMLEILDSAFLHKDMSEYYWNLLAHMVKESNKTSKLREGNQKLINFLIQREPEKSSKDVDTILCGILKVLCISIKKFEDEINDELVHLILHSCLFEIPESIHLSSNIPPKCKSSESRKEAFMLLLQLCYSSESALIKVMGNLNKLHEDPHWRTGKIAD